MNENTTITLAQDDQIIRNEEEFLSTEVDGEAVIMNVETGAYFGLNPVATDIWKILKDSKSVQTVIDQLIEEYDVSPQVCKDETIPVLTQMKALKIILPAG